MVGADDRDAMAGTDQTARDLLDEHLRPAPLGVGRVAPVHEDDVTGHGVGGSLRFGSTLPTSSQGVRLRQLVGYRHAVPSPPPSAPWRATLRRSVRLFRAFLVEQTDPARFYGALAADAASHVGSYTELSGRLLLDVGGGPGYFADAFERAGASYYSVDSDVGEMSMVAEPRQGSVIGSGMALPFADATVDVCYSSNVLEHVRSPG